MSSIQLGEEFITQLGLTCRTQRTAIGEEGREIVGKLCIFLRGLSCVVVGAPGWPQDRAESCDQAGLLEVAELPETEHPPSRVRLRLHCQPGRLSVIELGPSFDFCRPAVWREANLVIGVVILSAPVII